MRKCLQAGAGGIKENQIILSRGERQAKEFISESVAPHVRAVGAITQYHCVPMDGMSMPGLYESLLYHKAMAAYVHPTDFVFSSSSGRLMNPDQLREHLQGTLRKIGVAFGQNARRRPALVAALRRFDPLPKHGECEGHAGVLGSLNLEDHPGYVHNTFLQIRRRGRGWRWSRPSSRSLLFLPERRTESRNQLQRAAFLSGLFL